MTNKEFKQLKEKHGNSSSFTFSHWIDISMSYGLALNIIKELISEDLNRVRPECY